MLEDIKAGNPVVFQTSGSSGNPKDVSLDAKTLMLAGERFVNLMSMDKNSVYLDIIPHSIATATMSVVPEYITGCEVHRHKFSANYTNLVKELTPTHLVLPPNPWRMIRHTPGWKDLDLTGVTVLSGSDYIPESQKVNIEEKGGKFVAIYGSTEVPPPVLFSKVTHNMLTPAEDCEWFLEDDGNLNIKWKTQSEFWRSNDIFEENNGLLTIKTRKFNMFKHGANKVYPELVESDIKDKGATLALCKLEGRKPVVYYTADKDIELEGYKTKRVKVIETTPLGKIIRSQRF